MLGIPYGCTTLLLILARETGKDGLPELTLHILKNPGFTILSILNVIFLMTSIGGALRGCVVDFIFPSGMFLVYHWNDYSKYSFNFIVLYLCTIFGAVTDIIATYQAVIDAMNSLK